MAPRHTFSLSLILIFISACGQRPLNAVSTQSGGESNSVGIVGPMGPMGPAGPVGPQGPVGPRGEAGPQGLMGATGAQGAQGLQGLQGATGPQGPIGPLGPQGVQGPRGERGEAGSLVPTSCPSGFSMPVTGICVTAWRTDRRNYMSAQNECRQMGAHVCTHSELWAVWEEGWPLSGWMGNSGHDDLALCVNANHGSSRDNFDGYCAKSTNHEYRCCISASGP